MRLQFSPIVVLILVHGVVVLAALLPPRVSIDSGGSANVNLQQETSVELQGGGSGN